MRIPIALATLALGACLTMSRSPSSSTSPPVPALPGARAVHVRKADPPPGARDLGSVSVRDGGGGCGTFGTHGTYSHAIARLRNEAAIKGADYAQIMVISEPHALEDCFDDSFVIHATLYKLAPSSPSSPTPASPDDDCNPPCSPGYECDFGECEPVCNPECPSGQVCRPDRTCGPEAAH